MTVPTEARARLHQFTGSKTSKGTTIIPWPSSININLDWIQHKQTYPHLPHVRTYVLILCIQMMKGKKESVPSFFPFPPPTYLSREWPPPPLLPLLRRTTDGRRRRRRRTIHSPLSSSLFIPLSFSIYVKRPNARMQSRWWHWSSQEEEEGSDGDGRRKRRRRRRRRLSLIEKERGGRVASGKNMKRKTLL